MLGKLFGNSDLKKEVAYLKSMGFTEEKSKQALKENNYDLQKAIECLLPNMNEPNKRQKVEDSEKSNQKDVEMKQANNGKESLQLTIKDNYFHDQSMQLAYENSLLSEELIKFEPLNPDERQRQENFPVGLKNIGNTCYFNSLIQAYFYIPGFVPKILQYSDQQLYEQLRFSNVERTKSCKILITKLNELFSKMIMTNKRYTEPSGVLRALVDDFGQPILYGEQKDISEFNLNFLERIEEGLSERRQQQACNNNIDQLQKNNEEMKISDVDPIQQVNDSTLLQSTQLLNSAILDGSNSSNDSIDSLFFGQITQILKLNNSKRSKIFNQQKQRMGPIQVDINNSGNLFDAMVASSHEEILDFNSQDLAQSFLNSENNKANTIKETLVSELPKTLFFNIHRVNYDVKQKQLIKNNKKFEFEKIFYMDKFLLQNRSSDENINDQVQRLRDQQKLIQNRIKELDDYYKGISALELIEQSKLLIQSLPLQANQSQEEQASLINALTKCSESLGQQKKNLEQEQIELEQEITKLNSEQGIHQQNPYYLHAILVHEGDSEMGHYYVFIYDRNNKLWYKFNDYKVSVEDEEKVFQESIGGNNQKTGAYGLIYIDGDLAKVLDSQSFYDFNRHLRSVVPKSQTSTITSDNFKFTQEATYYQVNIIAKRISDKYHKRCEMITRFINTGKGSLQVDLINFNSYLIQRCNQVWMAKWLLLSQCVKEEHPVQLGLLELGNEDLIFNRICHIMQGQMSTINTQQLNTLHELWGNYKIYQKKAIVIKFIVLNLNERQWLKALQGLKFYEKTYKQAGVLIHPEQDFKPLDSNRTFILYCCSMVNKHIALNESQKALEFAQIAAYDAIQALEPSDNHYKQVIINLENSIQMNALPNDMQQQVIQLVEMLKAVDRSKIDRQFAVVIDDIPDILKYSFNKVDECNDMELFEDGYSTECLAASYFNIFELFRQKFKVCPQKYFNLINQYFLLGLDIDPQ